MSSNEAPVPESVVVTCLTCHERIGVSLAVAKAAAEGGQKEATP